MFDQVSVESAAVERPDLMGGKIRHSLLWWNCFAEKMYMYICIEIMFQ